MIYEYSCNNCDEKRDVIKPASQYNSEERCLFCGCVMTRAFAPRKVYFGNTSVQELKFNPAIGKAVTDREARQIAKERDWIEVGNEIPAKHLKVPEVEYPSFSEDDIKALTSK